MLIGKRFMPLAIGGLNIFINNFQKILMQKDSCAEYRMIKYFCKRYCRMY